MGRAHKLLLATAVALFPMVCASANAGTVDFTGISSALASSPAGQSFTYAIGGGPATGVLNVRLLSGDISTLTTGQGPDPGGFYILQNGPLTPALFRFSFDQPRGLLVASNETLTPLETNTFTLPSSETHWSVIAVSDATVNSAGAEVSFVGVVGAPAYGQFTISAVTTSFDFLVTNAPGFPTYGSALSINVLDQTTGTLRGSWGQLKSLYAPKGVKPQPSGATR